MRELGFVERDARLAEARLDLHAALLEGFALVASLAPAQRARLGAVARRLRRAELLIQEFTADPLLPGCAGPRQPEYGAQPG